MSSLNLVSMSINFFNIKYKEVSISIQIYNIQNGGLVINFGLLTLLTPYHSSKPFSPFLNSSSSTIVLHHTVTLFQTLHLSFLNLLIPIFVFINFILLLSNSLHILPTNIYITLSLSLSLCIYYFICLFCSTVFILSCNFTLN